MQPGPNMRRLQEMDVARTVRACVVAGPGDLMIWEVRAEKKIDGITLEVTGRGSDLEAAAASAIQVLTQNGSVLEPAPAEGAPALAGDAGF